MVLSAIFMGICPVMNVMRVDSEPQQQMTLQCERPGMLVQPGPCGLDLPAHFARQELQLTVDPGRAPSV